MAEFSRGVRKFWQEVARWKFGEIDGRPPEVMIYYSEELGFRLTTNKPADEVHHIIPGSWAEANGQLANEQTGLPVSRWSHRGNSGLPFTDTYSFHPDMEDARRLYRKGDKGAFRKASLRHLADSMVGLLPRGFDPNFAAELEQVMVQAAVEYVTVTGKKKPVSGKEKPRKRHWSDGLFD